MGASSTPPVDRIATHGWYGETPIRFLSIATRGWFPGAAIPPGDANVVTAATLSSSKSPRTWRMMVGTTPKPITYITQTTGGTAYTRRSVADSNAWDLSEVSKADIVVTEDGFQARVESIGVNSVTIEGWWKAGVSLDGRAEAMPLDGKSATVHHPIQAARVLIRSGKGNSGSMWLGMSRNVDVDNGHPITHDYSQPNSAIWVDAELDRWLNLSNVWLVAVSDQEAIITPKAFQDLWMG